MICPNCGANLPDGSAFCQNCGKPVNTNQQKCFCKNCGAQLPANAIFCDKCKTVQDNTMPRNVNAPAPKKKGKGHVVVLCCLAGALVIVAIIVGIILFLFNSFKSSYTAAYDIPAVDMPSITAPSGKKGNATKALTKYAQSISYTQTTVPYLAKASDTFYTAPDDSLPSDNSLGYQIADFDNDGSDELLLVKLTDNQLVYEMYESDGTDVYLNSSVVALNPQSLEVCVADTFTTSDAAQGVYLQYYMTLSHVADGLNWGVQQYMYDGVSLEDAGFIGTAGSAIEQEELEELSIEVMAMGLPQVEVWTSDMMCSQSSELNLLARVSVDWTCDNNAFYTWYNGNKAEDFQIGEISIGGPSVALPKQPEAAVSQPASSVVSHDAPATADGYILPQSSTEYISESDLNGFTSWDARLARNEILARHGRRFDTPEIQAYFDSCSWYNGTTNASDFNYGSLSKLEQDNIETIKAYEAKLS